MFGFIRRAIGYGKQAAIVVGPGVVVAAATSKVTFVTTTLATSLRLRT